MSAAEPTRLVDLVDEAMVRSIGTRLADRLASFDVEAFVAATISAGWDGMSFTQRSARIAERLHAELGLPDAAAVDLLLSTLPEPTPMTDADAGTGHLWMWPYGDFISRYATDDLELGLRACRTLTTRFTAEFAIRPLLARYPEALARIAEWTEDPDPRVRRLVSEGTRPRLPWAGHLRLPVEPVLAILSRLRADPAETVRRSVANHLNDLAKEHDEQVVDLLSTWFAEDVPETTWIVRHALRNDLKRGDPRVMTLFGYAAPQLSATLTARPDRVRIGDITTITLELYSSSPQTQSIRVDLVVDFVKAPGRVGRKVFTWRTIELAPKEQLSMARRLRLSHLSTRSLHPGFHRVAARVNGHDIAESGFELKEAR